MRKEKIKRTILFLLFYFGIIFIILSYDNLYISSITKPVGLILGAAFIGAMVSTALSVTFRLFYGKFLKRADAYLDKCLIEEELSVEEHD